MKLKTKFQDEDFELGEVVDANVFYSGNHREGFKVVAESKSGGEISFYYNSIKDFTDQWEDYEEPKGSALVLMILTLTNFIENEPDEDKVDLEDCKQMLDRLKAWKRLKDKGFKFEGIKEDYTRILQSQEPFRTGKRYLQFNKSEDEEWMKENWEDLDSLFGGEE